MGNRIRTFWKNWRGENDEKDTCWSKRTRGLGDILCLAYKTPKICEFGFKLEEYLICNLLVIRSILFVIVITITIEKHQRFTSVSWGWENISFQSCSLSRQLYLTLLFLFGFLNLAFSVFHGFYVSVCDSVNPYLWINYPEFQISHT